MAGETIPSKVVERIEFFEQRLPIWAASPAALNLLPADIVELSNAVAAARAAYDEAQAARNMAKAKTELQDIAIAALLDVARPQVKVIRAWAAKTNNPGVFALAQIPAPAEPAPLGPAETPTDLTSTLLNGGSIGLAWKGSREGGTSFRIYRSIVLPDQPAGSFTLLGTSEERSFVDQTLPTGLQQASYYVVAVRSGGASANSDPTTIFFGSGAGNPGATTGHTLTIAA